jgi:siroheme synthase
MDLVVVTVVPDIVSASSVKAMLEQADIPVMLRGSGSTNWLIPGTPGGAGPLDVLVPADRLAEAEELIAELEVADGEGVEDDAEAGG